MGEELQGTLARLASELGVSVGELLDYATGRGIQEYTKVRILEWGSLLVFFAVCLAATIYLDRTFVRRHEFRFEENRETFHYCAVGTAVIWVAGAMIATSQLVSWVVSPEGMLIRMVLQ